MAQGFERYRSLWARTDGWGVNFDAVAVRGGLCYGIVRLAGGGFVVVGSCLCIVRIAVAAVAGSWSGRVIRVSSGGLVYGDPGIKFVAGGGEDAGFVAVRKSEDRQLGTISIAGFFFDLF